MSESQGKFDLRREELGPVVVWSARTPAGRAYLGEDSTTIITSEDYDLNKRAIARGLTVETYCAFDDVKSEDVKSGDDAETNSADNFPV